MDSIKINIEEKALAYISEKRAQAITIHGPSFGCPCCSPGGLPYAALHMPSSRLDIYDRHPVKGLIVYFPRAAYGKLSDRKVVRVALEGFWIFKSLGVYGFAFSH